ncbi:MAG: fibrobacter succinogenes major paralogous domain-containing protein, partial [Flavobacterium sp.]|nr:fibrobacter succinogenes major paralogous domain-containing protein [Flavobacterium sp.]
PNVTDIDSNTYQSVTNCGLTFTKQNLNVSKYSDGTAIPQVTDPTAWQYLTTGAWCYYNNDPANGAVYGKLYNWYAVAGIYNAASLTNPTLRKKLAPTGWHVPTDGEWSNLINCLDVNADGGNNPNTAGGKMKATGTSLWISPNTDATNASGFTGLPGGYRYYDGGSFYDVGGTGGWWSSSEIDAAGAWARTLNYGNGSADGGNANKDFGVSVRCLRD